MVEHSLFFFLHINQEYSLKDKDGGWKKKKRKVKKEKSVSETIMSRGTLPPPNSCRGNTEEAEPESGISWQGGNAADSLRITKTRQRQLHP